MAQLIETLPNLQCLVLDGFSRIGNKTLKAIGRCSKLRELFLENCPLIGKGLLHKDKIYKNLAKLKKLLVLEIGNTSISSRAVFRLTRSFSLLENLSFGFNPYNPQIILKILKSVPRITTLTISTHGALPDFSKEYLNKIFENEICLSKNLISVKLCFLLSVVALHEAKSKSPRFRNYSMENR